MDTLAVFRSRSDALKIYSLLRKRKLACSTVNTPSSLGLGCGISVIFNGAYADLVKQTVLSSGVRSFAGFYRR